MNERLETVGDGYESSDEMLCEGHLFPLFYRITKLDFWCLDQYSQYHQMFAPTLSSA